MSCYFVHAQNVTTQNVHAQNGMSGEMVLSLRFWLFLLTFVLISLT